MSMFKDAMLKLFLTICVFYTTLQFGAEMSQHIPPIREGSCMTLLESEMPIQIKVVENHVLKEYSDIEVTIIENGNVFKKDGQLAFTALVDGGLQVVKCLDLK